MAREYDFYGRFKVKTTCPDLEKVARALNETARQFGDILQFSYDEQGYMWIYSDVELEIPVNEPVEEYEEEESEVDHEDE